jgi:hypothetical protein
VRRGGGHSHVSPHPEKNMYRKETNTTDRLTTEVIRSIGMTLLAKAEELERLQDPTQTEPPRPLPYDPAYDL